MRVDDLTVLVFSLSIYANHGGLKSPFFYDLFLKLSLKKVTDVAEFQCFSGVKKRLLCQTRCNLN